MSPEELKAEKVRRRHLARLRLRSLITKVKVNVFWLSELEDTQLGDNVRKNVQIIFQRKRTPDSLSVNEKSWLNVPAEYRTTEQIQRLGIALNKLRCLKRFSPIDRFKLAECAYYMYYNQGRTILREGHYPSAVYFILYGEVTILKKRWDSTEKVYKDCTIGEMGAGDVFGEIAIMNDTMRQTTCVTASNCELLVVYKEDFKRILLQTLTAQWNGIKKTLNRFKCFQGFTENQITECCILARVKQFEADETIYCENKGLLNHVHFLLSGQCMILQYLKLEVDSSNNGNNKYKLVSSKIKEEQGIQTKNEEEPQKPGVKFNDMVENFKKFENLKISFSSAANIGNRLLSKHRSTSLSKKHIQRFIDIGTFSSGSIFNLGEEIADRTIVARTPVQCLLIPRYWLLQKEQNIGNIWERNKVYLNITIPSREKVFIVFLQTQNWKKYKKKLMDSLVMEQQNKNATTIHDVPIICRIEDKLK